MVNASLRQRDGFPAMLSALSHRGPDADGRWHDDSYGLVIGHARLAVLDVSAAGAQPMSSANGRYVLTYNGEIYNHQEIRTYLASEFDRSDWRGESDTETLLVLIECVGVSAALQKIHGMFAFAVWDRDDQSLTIARDRMGEKPLYYGVIEGAAVFCSEMHAIRSNSALPIQIDKAAVSAFGQYGFIPAPLSIYQSITKLPAGTFAVYTLSQGQWSTQSYWSTSKTAITQSAEPLEGTDEALLVSLDNALSRVVEQEMISDVPFGAFLSGGIDSSLIVSMMQKMTETPVSTFTIGFNEKAYNEAGHAKRVAAHLKTDHTELYIEDKDLLDIVPNMGAMYDEPFSDESAIPTHLVSRLARTKVTVALSGDGGDELFCGYNRHHFAASGWGRIKRLPSFAKVTGSLAIRCVAPLIRTMSKHAIGAGTSALMKGDSSAKLAKLSNAVQASDIRDLYFLLLSGKSDGELWGVAGRRFDLVSQEPLKAIDDTDAMMLFDQLFYLPDDILVKVDRASMACSLETRAPFLHPEMVSLAWQMPRKMKFRNGVGKWALRELLYRYVPESLVNRPKAGFEVPVAHWLKNQLRDWVEELSSDQAIESHGLLSADAVRKLKSEHYSKGIDRSRELWRLVCFQSWIQAQGSPSSLP